MGEICVMDYLQIISGLNRRPDIGDIRVSHLYDFSLSKEEENFIQKYLPEQVLIIYGTLAPGKVNHSKIVHITGTWENAIVTGKLEEKGWGAALGFHGFRHVREDEQSAEIPAMVLHSTLLNENWAFLDDFEGAAYRRILSAYRRADGNAGVGYIYGING